MSFLRIILSVVTFIFLTGCCTPVKNMVLVEGGTFLQENKEGKKEEFKIRKFNIGIYEVTQKEWVEVMGSNPSSFQGDSLPVETVSWYDAVIYCNKRSKKEGLEECYTINELDRDSTNFKKDYQIKYEVYCYGDKNGYRLPTEEEWEYAARGGVNGRGFKYSGSDDLNEVGWYKRNSGDKILKTFNDAAYFDKDSLKIYNNSTKTVGSKKPNELGIFDMSGNVHEYCWNFRDYHFADYQIELGDPSYGRDVHVHLRTASGGSWMDDTMGSTKKDGLLVAPYVKDRSCGLRVVRKAGCFLSKILN
jgi:formylglycine-generating enzyme